MKLDSIYWNVSGYTKGLYFKQTNSKLSFITLGPEALYDAANGLDKVLWTFSVENNSVYIQDNGNKIKLFEESGEIVEITGTFDQLGFPIIFYRLKGAFNDEEHPEYFEFEEGTLKVYWYDTIEQNVKITTMGFGRSPFVLFDMLYQSSSEFSDYVLFYIEENTLKYRVQRERLDVVHVLPAEIAWNDLIDFVEMDETFRLQVTLKRVSWRPEDDRPWIPEEKVAGVWIKEI